jgi:hypothetical protein
VDRDGKEYDVRLAGVVPYTGLQGVDDGAFRCFAHHSLVYGQADVHGLALGKILNP